MRGVSGVVYLGLLLVLFTVALIGGPNTVWLVLALIAGVWLSLDIRSAASRSGEHLLEVTALINVGLIVILAVTTFGLAETPLLLAGLASVVHGVGFVEARSFGVTGQTIGVLEAAAGASLLVSLPEIAAVIALPATVLKIVLLRSVP